MWMILKTFKLSKNPWVLLFYFILIVTTACSQTDQQQVLPTNIQTEENINNATEATNVVKSDVLQHFLNWGKTQNKENEMNNIDLKENNTSKENQELDIEEDSIGNHGLSPESTTPGDLEPEENKIEGTIYQNSKEKNSEIIPEQDANENDLQTVAENKVETSDTEDLETTQTSDPEKNTIKNTQGPSESTTNVDLELAEKSIEAENNQNIKNGTKSSNKKKNKKRIFKEFTPTRNARIYCTFLGKVLEMYKTVKESFVGRFCHAIVFGAPIILKEHRVHLGEETKEQLESIHLHKELSLLIVIMQYADYNHWKEALHETATMKTLVKSIIQTVLHNKIDGIQFSNLYPTKEADEINPQMMNNLIKFFKKLRKSAKKKNHDLKIGITIDMHDLSITKSFTSFEDLNLLVTWYSFKSISMVTCSSEYSTTDTSPLEGNMGFKTSTNTLIEQLNHNNDFDMTKLVVGIQLFPNKENDSHVYTYEELCSSPKNTWDSWCAANLEDLRLKGTFLRDTQIGGVQLYYMHSDDYKSTCGCYSFPLIRALLRGLLKVETPETCDFKTAHN